MDKAQLESLIQKIMEQCVRDDYLIKNKLVVNPATLASPLPLHDRSCKASTSTGIANVQQATKLHLKLIQNQTDNSNAVNISFTEKYINNIYDFFYKLIHHEKYRYMDDYIFNPNNNKQKALNNNNYGYDIKFTVKPIIQRLKNRHLCNTSSDECNCDSNSNAATASVDIFGFVVLLIKITIHLIKSVHCEKIDSNSENKIDSNSENKIDWMIDAKYKKKLDKLFDYCFNEMKSAFLSEQLIDNPISLQNISKTTYDYNDFLMYWKFNFNHIQSVVLDIFDFEKQTIDKLLTLFSNENQLLDSEAASLLEQLIHKRMEMIILLFPVEMINHMEYKLS